MHRPAAIALTPILIALGAIVAFLVMVNFAITPPQAGSKTIIGWRTYTNKDLGFRFQYPPTLRAVSQSSSDPLSLRFEPLVRTGPIAAGVDELTMSVIDQPLSAYRATNGLMTDYQSLTVAGRTAYRSAVLQGIEGLIQNVLIGVDVQTVVISASGKRIELLTNILASFRYLGQGGNMACTEEAKLCPDGSSVGRTGPDCEFAECPTTNAVSNTNIANRNVNTGSGGCQATGCSGQVCSDKEEVTTCEYRAEYACYQSAICERQANGQCGWTASQALQTCLQAAGSGERLY